MQYRPAAAYLLLQVSDVLLHMRRLELQVPPVHTRRRLHRDARAHYEFLHPPEQVSKQAARWTPEKGFRSGTREQPNRCAACVSKTCCRDSADQAHQVQHPHAVVLRDWQRLQRAVKRAACACDLPPLHQQLQVLRPDARHLVHRHLHPLTNCESACTSSRQSCPAAWRSGP